MLFRVLISLSLVCIALCSDVLDYSGADFADRVAEHDAVLVEFFAPWCGHCKRLAPEYDKAAKLLKKNDPPVPLAKVDCTSDNGKETCSKYGVSGYPTLKIFRGGEFSAEYNGPRDADGIVKYMRGQVGPSSKELNSVEEVEAFLKKDSVIIFGFFKSDDTLKTEFLKVADKLRESTVLGHTSNDEVMKKFKHSDAIVLFRPKIMFSKFEPQEVVYDGPADKQDIQNFVKKNYHGLVGHRGPENHDDFKAPLVVAYYDVDYVKNVKGTNYWRNRIMKVAQNYVDKVNFAISDKNKFSAELEDYGLKISGDKPLVAARNVKSQKFNMQTEFSVENLEQFVNDFVKGKLEPYLKSEPIPESNDGDVKVAVAGNFEELVLNNPKDILIEFYAPWCGHCKKLAPTFEELGSKMKDEDVEIIKMDATANDVPEPFQVQGFPTLYWVPKDSKNTPLKYEGGRELDDMIKYIATHATEGLKGYDKSGKKKSKTEL